MAKSEKEISSRENNLKCLKKILRISRICLCAVISTSALSFNPVYAKESKIIKAPVISQSPELPTGCEATSAAMLLRWAGVKITKEQVARDLPKGNIPVLREGRLYGSNPNSVFVGNPFSKAGYGVFHQPIYRVIDKYLPGRAADITGISFDALKSVIDSGRPVIVWVTINMAPPRVSKVWYDDKGSKVVWVIPEHAVLLVGYTGTHVIVNDPWTGTTKAYPTATFIHRWQAMGRQAVTIK